MLTPWALSLRIPESGETHQSDSRWFWKLREHSDSHVLHDDYAFHTGGCAIRILQQFTFDTLTLNSSPNLLYCSWFCATAGIQMLRSEPSNTLKYIP